MDAKTVFVLAKEGVDVFPLRPSQRQAIPIHTEDHQTQARTQVPGNDIHKVSLPTVGIKKHQFFYPTGSHAVSHIGPQTQNRFRFERQGARKTVMFRTEPHRLGWQK